jgi:hypothetical protein
MNKRHIYLLLVLLLSSCASIIEKIEMTNPKLSCLKKEMDNEYSAFGIKFKKKSEVISLIPSESYCFSNVDSSGFSGTFETKNIISRTIENYKSGNSSFLKLTILSTKSLEKKYKTNQELKKVVEAFINKRVLEMKGNKNPRFGDFVNNLEKLNLGKSAICQNLFQSLNDYSPKNLPKSEKYLVMNTLYKTCAIANSDVVIDIGLSIRANSEFIKNFDSEYLKNYATKVEKDLVDKVSEKDLNSIITE